MTYRVVRVDAARRAELAPRIVALERRATYPLGDDRFRIDHGRDYFAFFERLGEVRFYAVLAGSEVVAVGAGVLRTVHGHRAWYVCDLKVHPDHQGRRIPYLLFRSAFLRNWLRCRRGYGISMNPGDGRPNRVAAITARWWWTPIRLGPELLIWSLDADAAARVTPVVERLRGPLSWLSLAGVKDIVLESTGKPMPLLHAQPGDPQPAGARSEVQPGAVHMVCAPRGDALADALLAMGLPKPATATILHHRMHGADWRFVRTSDI